MSPYEELVTLGLLAIAFSSSSSVQEPAVHAQRIHRMIKLGLGIDEADEEVGE